jgi:TrmH family RNA methyltransferase
VPDITSRQHPVVRAFRDAARGDGGMALLDGWHLLRDAAEAGVDIRTVAVAGSPPSGSEAALLDRLARTIDVFTVSTSVMDAISPVRTPAGIAAIARRISYALIDLFEPAPPLVVVACDIQDPGNAGAIVRSAEAGGATGVLMAGASANPWHWKSLRAAMGSTFRLPVVCRHDTSAAIQDLRDAGLAVLATVPRGGVAIDAADLRDAVALVVGGEGRGLPADVIAQTDGQLTIRMREPVESLNAAVAAALVVYEAARQRRMT